MKKDDLILILFFVALITYGYFVVFIFDQLFVIEQEIKTSIFKHYNVPLPGKDL